ncbi:RNA polymerase II associated protein 2 [Rhizophlyctis rosea]|nr:RNA polymerase II associated protein 2 [Rhizophlyctis rosea]
MLKSLTTRKEWEDRVFEWQMKISEGAVSAEVLAEAALLLRPEDYNEVVVERAAVKICGYPLCEQVPKVGPQVRKGKYRIDTREQKVYDITELNSYCSPQCLAASKYTLSQLSPDPAYMRNFDTMQAIEIIPLGYTLADIQPPADPSKAEVSRDQLLTNYVQSLLSALPSNVSGHSITVHEKESTEPTPPRPQGDHETIEGFKVEPKRLKTKQKSAASTGVAKRRNIGDSSTTMRTEVVEMEKQLQSLSVSTPTPKSPPPKSPTKPHSPPSPAITNAQPTHGLHPQSHTDGPAAPHRPVTSTASNNKTAGREIAEASWLRPSRKRDKPVLSLFGKMWTNLSHMITADTKEFVRVKRAGGESGVRVDNDEIVVARKDIFFKKINTM